MAIRWRENGTLMCAAMSEAEIGDIYIHDGIHYILSVLSHAIVADKDHKRSGLWYWNTR